MLRDDKIKFHCICGRRLVVPSKTEGRRARCPVCQTVVIVPGGPVVESSIVTPGSLASGKLIVAQYDFENTLNLMAFLARKGFDVRSATEGMGLSMMVSEDLPDAIVVSCDLPNMEEEQAWERLKGIGQGADRPILIVLQGEDEDPPPVEVDTIVQRPVDARELLHVIEKHLLAKEARLERGAD